MQASNELSVNEPAMAYQRRCSEQGMAQMVTQEELKTECFSLEESFDCSHLHTLTTVTPFPTETIPDEASQLKSRSSLAAVVWASPVSSMY